MPETIGENLELLKNIDIEIEQFNEWVKNSLKQEELDDNQKNTIKVYLIYIHETS